MTDHSAPFPDTSVRPIRVRRASEDDVDGIRRIDTQVYSSPWSRSMVLQQVNGPDRVHLVAERGGDVVAHAGLLFLAGEAHVSSVAVDPAMQRQGIGQSMLIALFRCALARDCTALTLEVRSDNRAALALYRRFGLAPAGIRRGYYAETGEDALVLWSPPLTDAYADRIRDMPIDPRVELAPELEGVVTR